MTFLVTSCQGKVAGVLFRLKLLNSSACSGIVGDTVRDGKNCFQFC